jgi:hypothetical protein
LQCVFPLHVLMVPSSVLALLANGEHLTCGGFSHGKTVRFGKHEFIADCFGGLSLSPRGSDLNAALMGPTRSGPLSLLRAKIEDITEEFQTVSSREEDTTPSPRRHNTRALPTPVTTAPWLEGASATQATMMVPP